MADTISGSGAIRAAGGTAGGGSGTGGTGLIRLEANTNTIVASNPQYTFGTPGSVFPSNSPTLTVTSIAGLPAPSNPTGSYSQPDIPLPSTTTNPVEVTVTATNIPVGTAVQISSIPLYGTPLVSSPNPTLSGTQQSSTATANVNISTIYSNVITAQATFTIVGFNYNGEEIEKVRVAATAGGKSETTYITKSGKEIKGELVAALRK